MRIGDTIHDCDRREPLLLQRPQSGLARRRRYESSNGDGHIYLLPGALAGSSVALTAGYRLP
jgi:hypothetical protein